MVTPFTSTKPKPASGQPTNVAIRDQRDALKADGWKFRDYADGRWMGTHKARGLKTAKHDSMVEVIYEAARLAETPVAEAVEAGTPAAERELEELREVYGEAGSHAEANEGSAYEGQDVAALLEATEREQRGRWEALGQIEENLKHGHGKRRTKELEKERGNLLSLYEGTYSEVADASGHEAAEQMRERVETEHRPDDVPASADPATSGDDSGAAITAADGDVVEHTPAPDAASAEPSLKDKLVERHNGNVSEPRTFRETVEVKFNDHDIAERARTLSLLRVQIEELTAEMQKTVKGYKDKLAGLEEQCAELFRAIRRGHDELELEVYERRDYDRHTVELRRFDTCELISERPMRPTEMQPPLPSI
jgi:hypothetical protein